MDDLGYLDKEKNKNAIKTKKRTRYILLVFMFFMICIAVVLGVAFYYKYDNTYDNRIIDISENDFTDLDILEVEPRIDIANDQQELFRDNSYVSTVDLEQYVFLKKVGSSIYLIPNDNSKIDVYKSEDGKLIIEIKD